MHLVQALWLVLEDLHMSDINKLTPIYSDNQQGSVYWSKGWTNQRICHITSETWQSKMRMHEHKEINIEHIEVGLNTTDIRTKE
jgi:hypothetical protein